MTQGIPDASFLSFAINEKREQIKTASAQEANRLHTEIRGLERLLEQQESDHVQRLDNRSQAA